MNDLKSLIGEQAYAQELDQAQQGRADNAIHFAELLQQIKETRLLSQKGFGDLEREATHRQKQQVLKWLSAADARSDQDHHRGCRNKTDGGHWLLRNKRFLAWIEATSDASPLLWVTGIPGAGNCSLKSTRQFVSSHYTQGNPYLRLSWSIKWKSHRAQHHFFSFANMTTRKGTHSSEWPVQFFISSF